MVGYSRLVGLDDVGTVERFKRLRQELIDPGLKRYSGRVVQTAGDSLLVIFNSVAEAVTCALEMQRRIPLYWDNVPPEQQIRFRVGIELGDVLAHGLDLHGETVSIAARLEAICPPGAVCISRAVHEHIKHTVAAQFTHIGQLRLKNIARPIDGFMADPTHPASEMPSASPGMPTDANTRPYASPTGGAPLVAVLPFDQFGETRVPDHITEGMVADIVCQLAGLRELRVISHGSTLNLRGSATDPLDAGRRLGARYVARGAFHNLGLQTRLITELIDTRTSEVVLARNTDSSNVLSFESQDRIVGQIVNTLAPRVREIELRRIRGSRPDSLSVYEKILLAREHISMLQRNGFIQAKQLLNDVICEEPEYAEAYALAADWHGLMIGQGWSSDRAADTAAVDQLTLHALSLDADNVRALVYYGHRKSLLHRDYPTALKLFQHALNVSPSSAHAWLKSSYTFAYIGEPAEAIRRAEHAVVLSPCDREPHLFYSALCTAHYTAGNYDVAGDWGLKTLSERTMLRNTSAWTAASLAAAGRVREANEVRHRTISQWPHGQVRNAVARHPYRDLSRRQQFGEHLLAAGYPP
jgi:adenylate cyclase